MNDPSFASQFAGRSAAGLVVTKDGGKIEAITAATITSRAVCRAIAHAAAKLK
jgi:electron transport complex protein RnfG